MICASVAILFPSSSYFWNHFLVRASRCWFLYHQSSWSTQCSACIRSLSSPEISQRASSSLFTLKHLTDGTTPAANVHSIRSWLPQHTSLCFRSIYCPLTRTQNQLSFDCSAFEVKWSIELRLKWTLNLSISYLGDHCLNVRASPPLKLGSRKWWTALVWKNNPCWHFVSRSRIRHVEHMSAYPLLLSDPVLCNLMGFFFSLAVNKEMMSLFSSFPPLS